MSDKAIRRPNGIIVLEAMLDGRKVKIDGQTWCMSEDHEICMPAKHYKGDLDGEYEEVGMKVEMSVGVFFNMCEKLTEEEVFTISAESVLTEINRAGGTSKWTSKQERRK